MMDWVTNFQNRKFLSDKILPTIRENWPSNGAIKIQRDSAIFRLFSTNSEFYNAVIALDLSKKAPCQPPYSPDVKDLDLGYFNDVQSLQLQAISFNDDKIISSVSSSFEYLNRVKPNNISLGFARFMYS